MWRYAGIETYDINNGLGVGATLFIQGCARHCPGCHNPQTWSWFGGMPYTKETDEKLFRCLDDPNIVRLTISGGEPFAEANIPFTTYVGGRFKLYHPEKKLWVYTGYSYDDLFETDAQIEFAAICDVIVDGAFDIKQKCLSLPFRGSRNQRIIDVNRTIITGQVVEMI